MAETPETIALIERYQQHRDERAISALFKANDRFLRRCAVRGAFKYAVSFDDAMQAARLGFLRAVERWEPGHGANLDTYSRAWVRHFLATAHAEAHAGVLPPSLMYDGRLTKLWKAVNALRDEGTPVTDDALAAATGFTMETIRGMRTASDMVYLDAPIGDEDDGATLQSKLASREDRPDQMVERKLDGAKVLEAIESVLDGFDDRDVDIYRGRFEREETLEEIGQRHGITRERVRQLELSIVERLRESLSIDWRVVGLEERAGHP